jgi:hypothetical protein
MDQSVGWFSVFVGNLWDRVDSIKRNCENLQVRFWNFKK